MTEIGLPRSEFVPALLSFNAGVECGQLTVIFTAFLMLGLGESVPRLLIVVNQQNIFHICALHQ